MAGWILIAFTIASACCALAPTIGILIAARALQGMVGASLVPLAMSLLLGREGAARQLPASAGMLLFLAPALGPTIGGLLLRLASWPLIFLVNVPFGIAGAAAMVRLLAATTERGDRAVRFDPFGLVVLSCGLMLAIYGATQGPQRGWSAPATWATLMSGGALIAVYVAWALRRPHPAVDLKLLRHRQTALAVGLCGLVSIVMFSMLVLIPLFMQTLQGLSPLVTGLALLPQGLVTGLGTQLGNTVPARYGVRRSAMAGLALLAAGTAALLLVDLSTPGWVTALILCARGLAIGLVTQPLLTYMIGDLEPSEVPDGNALFNVAQRLGSTLGLSLLTTILTVREQARVADAARSLGARAAHLSSAAAARLPAPLQHRLAEAAVAGFHDTIWLLVGLSLLGLCAATLVHPSRVPVSPVSP